MKLIRKLLSSITATACCVSFMCGGSALLTVGADTYGEFSYSYIDEDGDKKFDYLEIDYVVYNESYESTVSVDIPAEYDGLPVKSIANGAFWNCTRIASMTIPNSVTSIGYSAFEGCTSLKSITIPDSVTSIGYNAFSNTALVNSQTGIKYVSNWVADCDENITSAEIKKGIKGIVGKTFYNCKSLRSITLPSSITSIGTYAFTNCPSLESVTILNPKCKIDMSDVTICNGYDENGNPYYKGTIYGYADSTAKTYADTHKYKFLAKNEYGILSDADGDGNVSAKDASLIFSEFKKVYGGGSGVFTGEQIKRCDLNGDGKITAIDASKAFSIYKENYRRG